MNGNGHTEPFDPEPDDDGQLQCLAIAYQSLLQAYAETTAPEPDWNKVAALSALSNAGINMALCGALDDDFYEDEDDEEENENDQ